MSTLVDVFASMRARMQDMSRLMRIAGGKVNQVSACLFCTFCLFPRVPPARRVLLCPFRHARAHGSHGCASICHLR